MTSNLSGGAPFPTCACVYNQEKMCISHLYIVAEYTLEIETFYVQQYDFLACKKLACKIFIINKSIILLVNKESHNKKIR